MAPELRILLAAAAAGGRDVSGSFIHLRNPKSGTRACYLMLDGMLQEINWFKPRYASWFIGDSVCEDGSLYLGSMIDPLFVVLPLLEESRMKKADEEGMFRSLEDILCVENYPCYSGLSPLLGKSLDVICDSRELGGVEYYRLDDTKLLGWLCCKVKHISDALKQHGFESLGDDELKAYSIGLLGEYLAKDPWLQRLCDHFNINLETSKKTKESAVPLQPVTAAKQNAKSSKKAKLVAAAAAGPKITSFFARPR